MGAPTFVSEIDSLHELLMQELAVVEELRALAMQKRDAIMERNHALVESASNSEDKLVAELTELESRRARVMAQANLGPTLQDVLNGVSDPDRRDELSGLADRLHHCLMELDDVNKTNAGLLYCSLAVVQTMLGALSGNESRGTIYGPTPSAQERKDHGILDWRA